MNLRFVEAFYWVATLQSVTRAAEKLSLTQSAMSSRVAALETELGVLLLDRSLRRVRLTVAGTRFLGHARAMLDLMREARDETRSLAGQAAPLRLGAIESVMQGWLAPWMREVALEQPALAIEYSVDRSAALLEQLQRGTLDLAFTALPATGEGFSARPLPSQDMVFVASAERHARAVYTLGELAGAAFMTGHRGSHSNVALLELFRQQRLTPRAVHAIASLASMAQLAEAGFGIAVMPEHAARSLLPGHALRVIDTTPAMLPMSTFVSHRADAATQASDRLLRSALAFIASRCGPAKPRPPSLEAPPRATWPGDAAGRSPAWLPAHS